MALLPSARSSPPSLDGSNCPAIGRSAPLRAQENCSIFPPSKIKKLSVFVHIQILFYPFQRRVQKEVRWVLNSSVKQIFSLKRWVITGGIGNLLAATKLFEAQIIPTLHIGNHRPPPLLRGPVNLMLHVIQPLYPVQRLPCCILLIQQMQLNK